SRCRTAKQVKSDHCRNVLMRSESSAERSQNATSPVGPLYVADQSALVEHVGGPRRVRTVHLDDGGAGLGQRQMGVDAVQPERELRLSGAAWIGVRDLHGQGSAPIARRMAASNSTSAFATSRPSAMSPTKGANR